MANRAIRGEKLGAVRGICRAGIEAGITSNQIAPIGFLRGGEEIFGTRLDLWLRAFKEPFFFNEGKLTQRSRALEMIEQTGNEIIAPASHSNDGSAHGR